ncbi:MAG: serine/threonine protein kinase [Planctomycetaceae bacterium]|nr:serine/threonine protein kinase [Planctomycetaceae bacterium]
MSGLVGKATLDKLFRASYDYVVRRVKTSGGSGSGGDVSAIDDDFKRRMQLFREQNGIFPAEFKRNCVRLRYGKLSSVRLAGGANFWGDNVFFGKGDGNGNVNVNGNVNNNVNTNINVNVNNGGGQNSFAALDGGFVGGVDEGLRLTELDYYFAEALVSCGVLNRWQVTQLLAGRTKFTLGKYWILDAIGGGGYGHVFLGCEYGVDVCGKPYPLELLLSSGGGDGALVALKVLPVIKSTVELSERFRNEIGLQRRLRHPNLLRFIDSGHDGNVDYMVHEFIDGGDVKMLLQSEGEIQYDVAAAIIVELSKAVQYLHDCGIIHRDIKPANILLSSSGVVKLIDLGLSVECGADRVSGVSGVNSVNGVNNVNGVNSVDGIVGKDVEVIENFGAGTGYGENYLGGETTGVNATASVGVSVSSGAGKIAGTIDYVAPDQIRNPSEPSPLWDIYSIGCVFYQLLTGKPPFPSGDLKQKLAAHVATEPLDPRVFNQTIPFHIAEITLAMLEKNPAKRIQSAQEIVEKLTAWIPPDGLEKQIISTAKR